MVNTRAMAIQTTRKYRPVPVGQLLINGIMLLFLAVSLVLLFFTRPLAVRYMKRGIPRTNVNSLIGKKAVVIQKIDNLSQTGQVRINDIEWMARTESDGETIPEESVVEIEAVRGVKLIVKKCKEEL